MPAPPVAATASASEGHLCMPPHWRGCWQASAETVGVPPDPHATLETLETDYYDGDPGVIGGVSNSPRGNMLNLFNTLATSSHQSLPSYNSNASDAGHEDREAWTAWHTLDEYYRQILFAPAAAPNIMPDQSLHLQQQQQQHLQQQQQQHHSNTHHQQQQQRHPQQQCPLQVDSRPIQQLSTRSEPHHLPVHPQPPLPLLSLQRGDFQVEFPSDVLGCATVLFQRADVQLPVVAGEWEAEPTTNSNEGKDVTDNSLHPTGCKPCAFRWTKGCANGDNCPFCHEWHPPRKKKPMRDQKNLMIIARRYGKIEFLRCSLAEALQQF